MLQQHYVTCGELALTARAVQPAHPTPVLFVRVLIDVVGGGCGVRLTPVVIPRAGGFQRLGITIQAWRRRFVLTTAIVNKFC